MPWPRWCTGLDLPCTMRTFRTTLPPKAWPMVWWPRQTPRMGSSPASAATAARDTPASSGVQGPGESTSASGLRRRMPSTSIWSFRNTSTSRVQLAQELHQVEGEGVVVVDEQEPRPGVAPRRKSRRPSERAPARPALELRSCDGGPAPSVAVPALMAGLRVGPGHAPGVPSGSGSGSFPFTGSARAPGPCGRGRGQDRGGVQGATLRLGHRREHRPGLVDGLLVLGRGHRVVHDAGPGLHGDAAPLARSVRMAMHISMSPPRSK